MFTAFSRDILLAEVNSIKSKQSTMTNSTVKISCNTKNIFINEGSLPERFSLVLKKFESGQFMFKQSKHIIDINKGEPLLNKFVSEDINGLFSGALVNLFEQLKSNEFSEYKTKTGNLMVPCLVDVDYYCPICDLIQTMSTISSANLEQLNQSSKYYDLIEMIHKVANLISQTFYKIDNYVFFGLLYDEQIKNCSIKCLTISNQFFSSVVSKISEQLKEQGLLLSEVDYVRVKIVGTPVDRFTYSIESVDVSFGDYVTEFVKHEGIQSEFDEFVNVWSASKVKSILYKHTLKQLSDVEQKFGGLIQSTTELLVDLIKDELSMLQ